MTARRAAAPPGRGGACPDLGAGVPAAPAGGPGDPARLTEADVASIARRVAREELHRT